MTVETVLMPEQQKLLAIHREEAIRVLKPFTPQALTSLCELCLELANDDDAGNHYLGSLALLGIMETITNIAKKHIQGSN